MLENSYEIETDVSAEKTYSKLIYNYNLDVVDIVIYLCSYFTVFTADTSVSISLEF